MICVIDLPEAHQVCERMSVRVRGWVIAPAERRPAQRGICVKVGSMTVVSTTRLRIRHDVAAAHALPTDLPTGFDLFFELHSAEPGSLVTLEVWAEFRDGPPMLAGTRTIRLSREDYTRGHFAPLLAPGESDILHRRHIYTSGPSSPDPSAECLAVLLERLDPRTSPRLLDVGCGLGAYARPLREAGFDWVGLEISDTDCASLERMALPHRRGDGHILPFDDRSFDAALCIEVLEHVEDCDALLREISRVATEAVFSVPNCELIPYYSRLLTVPWHLLESSHLNFFSRWTLRALLERFFPYVEISAYGPAPLRSVEGGALYYHLLAHVRR